MKPPIVGQSGTLRPSGTRPVDRSPSSRASVTASPKPRAGRIANPPQTATLRHKESGFALLLVFLMAAVLAISLYMEIPRVAFETQRQKEQLLIERGEQYKRAIQVFVRKNNRWPTKIEDLESTNNQRFLRRRYVDPMTGKDEWRMVHIQNGILTDSVTTKQPGQDKQKDGWTGSTYIGEQAGLGQTLPGTGQPGSGGVNLANRRRDSDNNPNAGRGPTVDTTGAALPPGSYPPGTIGPNGQPMPMPGTVATGQPYPTQTVPGQVPGQIPGQMPGQVPGQPGMPQLPPGAVVAGINPGRGIQPPNGAPGSTGSTNPGATSGGSSYLGGGGSYLGSGSYLGGGSTVPVPITGRPNTGQPGFNQPGFPPGNPVNSQTGGVSPMQGSPYPTAPGSNGTPPGFQQPGIAMNPQAQNAAAQLIGGILTSPRPGGMPTSNTSGMQTMGGGIAGFASTADEDSIMVYNDHTNYGEWEFIFDPAKVKPLANPNSGSIGTPASQIGSQIGTPANQVGTPAGGVGSTPFGAPGGFGTPAAPPTGPRQ
jgi:uncharacterized membrane protein YgcG